MAKVRVISTKWRIFLRDLNRVATVGEQLTILAMSQRPINTATTDSGDRLTKYFVAFAECCEECRMGHAHHSWMLRSIEQLLGPPREDTQLELGMKKKKGYKPVSGAEAIRMITEIMAVWQPASKCLHVANVKYSTIGSVLRIERIMKHGREIASYRDTETVARAYGEPLAEYYNSIEDLLKTFQEGQRLLIESIDTVTRSLLGYGAMFRAGNSQILD